MAQVETQRRAAQQLRHARVLDAAGANRQTTRPACAATSALCVATISVASRSRHVRRSSSSTWLRRFGVEIAGRLVGEHELRLVHDCARDRDALLLAARKVLGESVDAAREAELVEQRPSCVAEPSRVATSFSASGSSTFSPTVSVGIRLND